MLKYVMMLSKMYRQWVENYIRQLEEFKYENSGD